MTLYLAIDTASDTGSVAVGEPGRVIAKAAVPEGRHAAELMNAVTEVIGGAGASSRDLAGVVVGDGPGSFTGIRIAFATALGMIGAQRDLSLHTIPSLMGAAWKGVRAGGGGGGGVGETGAILALYDALRGEVFAALYRFREARVETLLAPRLTTVEQLERLSPALPDAAVGDGAVRYDREVSRWIGRPVLPPSEAGPSAGALVELMSVKGAAVTVTDPLAVEPEYGRKAAAQVKWETEHGRPLPHPAGD